MLLGIGVGGVGVGVGGVGLVRWGVGCLVVLNTVAVEAGNDVVDGGVGDFEVDDFEVGEELFDGVGDLVALDEECGRGVVECDFGGVGLELGWGDDGFEFECDFAVGDEVFGE